jgi:hypothetical protein
MKIEIKPVRDRGLTPQLRIPGARSLEASRSSGSATLTESRVYSTRSTAKSGFEFYAMTIRK